MTTLANTNKTVRDVVYGTTSLEKTATYDFETELEIDELLVISQENYDTYYDESTETLNIDQFNVVFSKDILSMLINAEQHIHVENDDDLKLTFTLSSIHEEVLTNLSTLEGALLQLGTTEPIKKDRKTYREPVKVSLSTIDTEQTQDYIRMTDETLEVPYNAALMNKFSRMNVYTIDNGELRTSYLPSEESEEKIIISEINTLTDEVADNFIIDFSHSPGYIEQIDAIDLIFDTDDNIIRLYEQDVFEFTSPEVLTGLKDFTFIVLGREDTFLTCVSTRRVMNR